MFNRFPFPPVPSRPIPFESDPAVRRPGLRSDASLSLAVCRGREVERWDDEVDEVDEVERCGKMS